MEPDISCLGDLNKSGTGNVTRLGLAPTTCKAVVDGSILTNLDGWRVWATGGKCTPRCGVTAPRLPSG